MLFYSTVAIVIGTLLGGIGLFYIIRKENGLKNLKKLSYLIQDYILILFRL